MRSAAGPAFVSLLGLRINLWVEKDVPPPFCDAGIPGSPPGMRNISWDHLWSLCTACEMGQSGVCFILKWTVQPSGKTGKATLEKSIHEG